MDDSAKIDETVARVRRIETRLTRYLTDIGSETGARKPFRDHNIVTAPGYHSTLSDLFSTIGPAERGLGKEFHVFIDGVRVATLYPVEGAPISEKD